MVENTLILGVALEEKCLKISSYSGQETELANENFLLDELYSEEEIYTKLEQFLNEKRAEEETGWRIVFTCEDSKINLIKTIEKRLHKYGIPKENLRIISQENAFLHYVLNQEESLHQHTVFLFDFNGNHLTAYRMAHSKKKMPLNYKAEKNVLGTFTLSGSNKEKGKILDEKFAGIAKQVLSKEAVSAVYLTGNGFEGGWLKKSLKILCDGKRAFLGQNLYSSGCCYYGKMMVENPAKDFMIQAPETVLYEAGVLDGGNRDGFVKITEAGDAWYDTKGGIDVILERGGKLDVVFVNTMTKEKQVESVDISALPARPKKIGRLRVEIQFFDSKTGVITVCDKGFGDFMPTTHQVFLKEFTLL